MKRRLRKKKRIGEFQELGFEVLADLRDGLSPIEFDAFLDGWISASGWVIEALRRGPPAGRRGHDIGLERAAAKLEHLEAAPMPWFH